LAPWQKWWLLFTVIWVVVAAIQVATILGVSEEPEKAWRPVLFGLGVPALLYLIGWLWFTWRGRPPRAK
jgi:hypothetical protein